jgi:hypothetical protein
MARAKAETISRQRPDELVIGADQVLALDDEIFEKPVARMRKRRLSVKESDTKSSDHRSFGPLGSAIRRSYAQGPVAAATLAHLKFLIAVEPPEALLFM